MSFAERGSGRAMRRAKAYTKGNVGQGQIRDMVMISERPAEIADRAVPGHWEGDLIFGTEMTAIATLVERHSRCVILVKLPHGHGGTAVRTAMAKKIVTLPAQLRRSITWDQGKEMAEHCPVHRRHRRADLLLRPQEPLATRLQRVHQPATAPIPAEEGRPVPALPTRTRHDRPLTQHPASTNPRLDDTITNLRQRRCDHSPSTQHFVDRGRVGSSGEAVCWSPDLCPARTRGAGSPGERGRWSGGRFVAEVVE